MIYVVQLNTPWEISSIYIQKVQNTEGSFKVRNKCHFTNCLICFLWCCLFIILVAINSTSGIHQQGWLYWTKEYIYIGAAFVNNSLHWWTFLLYFFFHIFRAEFSINSFLLGVFCEERKWKNKLSHQTYFSIVTLPKVVRPGYRLPTTQYTVRRENCNTFAFLNFLSKYRFWLTLFSLQTKVITNALPPQRIPKARCARSCALHLRLRLFSLISICVQLML